MIEKTRNNRLGFTLIELIVVVIILSILVGVALPIFLDQASDAKTSTTKGTLSGVRAAIATWYMDAAMLGSAAYPTHANLIDIGEVVQESIPDNPFNETAGVEEITVQATADNRDTDDSTGWRYWVDNTSDPPRFVFWANSSVVSENTW